MSDKQLIRLLRGGIVLAIASCIMMFVFMTLGIWVDLPVGAENDYASTAFMLFGITVIFAIVAIAAWLVKADRR